MDTPQASQIRSFIIRIRARYGTRSAVVFRGHMRSIVHPRKVRFGLAKGSGRRPYRVDFRRSA